MGLFSSSEEDKKPDVTVRSNRQICWASRDEFFKCLDKHSIEDAVKNSKEATKKCGPEEQQFEKDCIKSWVEYFKQKRVNEIEKERQIKILEERGAVKLDSTPRFK